MTNPPTINAESELVARLRNEALAVFSATFSDRNRVSVEDASRAANRSIEYVIERFASANEQGRREGIEMAAQLEFVREQAEEFASGRIRSPLDTGFVHHALSLIDYKAYAGRVQNFASDVLKALSPAPPPEKGERIPSGEREDEQISGRGEMVNAEGLNPDPLSVRIRPPGPFVLVPRELNVDFGAILDRRWGPDATWSAILALIEAASPPPAKDEDED